MYDSSHAFLAALFLFIPGTWLLAMLIINGNIGDALYKLCGSVGFFGVTDEQLGKLLSISNAGNDGGDGGLAT